MTTMTRRLSRQLPVTLTGEAFRSGVPCALHDLPWCATCSGRDKRSVIGLPDGAACIEVWPPSICEAAHGGRCPVCGKGYRVESKIGYSKELGDWVPLSCCGTPSTDEDETTHLIREARYQRWRSVPYPSHWSPGQLPDTMTDDHQEDDHDG